MCRFNAIAFYLDIAGMCFGLIGFEETDLPQRCCQRRDFDTLSPVGHGTREILVPGESAPGEEIQFSFTIYISIQGIGIEQYTSYLCTE